MKIRKQPDDDELVNIKVACRIWGGSEEPVNPATVYRAIKRGTFPKPIKLSPQIRRWRLGEIRQAIADLADARS